LLAGLRSARIAAFPSNAPRSAPVIFLHIAGEWQWLVRQGGRDVAEGAAQAAADAKQEAEAVALKLG
jgi:hypothetical protein